MAKTKKFELFIGLKDQNSYDELFDVETFAKVISKVCEKRKIGFSMVTQLGGYEHNKGYVTETSLRVSLIGANKQEVLEIGEFLKDLINTDTIMVTEEECDCIYF